MKSVSRESVLSGLILPSVLLVSGCAGSTFVRHHEADTTRTVEYATFRLNEPTVGETDPKLAELLVRGLEDKGYRMVDQGAELVVTYKLLVGPVREEAASDSTLTAVDDMFTFTDDAADSHNKVLLVLMQDAETLDTVWVGWSQADAPEDEVERRARDALAQLVDRIPVRARTPTDGARAAR